MSYGLLAGVIFAELLSVLRYRFAGYTHIFLRQHIDQGSRLAALYIAQCFIELIAFYQQFYQAEVDRLLVPDKADFGGFRVE